MASGRSAAARRSDAGVSDSPTNTPGMTAPPSSARSPSARTCSWSSHSPVSPTGATGTSAASRSFTHSARGRRRNSVSSSAVIHPMFPAFRTLTGSLPTRGSASTSPAPTARRPRSMNAG